MEFCCCESHLLLCVIIDWRLLHVERIRSDNGLADLPVPGGDRSCYILHLRGCEESPAGQVSQPAVLMSRVRVALVSVVIGTISMWIMWACTYMHQMNPIIQPLLMVKKE